jgi:XRE family transcriptional regulator, master regulator for biofilm formation
MIGGRIKKLREQKGYTITQLAELAAISKSYLSCIERNLQSNPSIDFLMKLTGPLEVSLDFLLSGINSSDNDNLPFKDESTFDEEWQKIIHQAIDAGVNKEDFKLYLDFIKFKNWEKDQT